MVVAIQDAYTLRGFEQPLDKLAWDNISFYKSKVSLTFPCHPKFGNYVLSKANLSKIVQAS